MSHPASDPSAAAIDSAYVVVTARKLADRWRDRAAALEKYAPAATVAWSNAADELEAHMTLPTRTEALRQLIEKLRADLADDLRRILQEEQAKNQNELPF